MDARVEQIINSKYKAYMVVTGGGTGCLPLLLKHGGASSFLLEFISPYSQKAFDRFLFNGTTTRLKDTGIKYCSVEAVDALARRASIKALELAETTDTVLGIAMTASLNKHTPQRKGRINQAFMSIGQNNRVVYCQSLTIESDVPRPMQELHTAEWCLDEILEFIKQSD